jgi:hypothetical protein
MKQKNVVEPRYALPKALARVKATAFSFGLEIMFIPSALSHNLSKDESEMYALASSTCVALLTARCKPGQPPLTNDSACFYAEYVPAFVQGYHFGRYAAVHGFHHVLYTVAQSERYHVLFRFAWEVFAEELAPVATSRGGALMQVDAHLKRLYQQYSTQNGREVGLRGASERKRERRKGYDEASNITPCRPGYLES